MPLDPDMQQLLDAIQQAGMPELGRLSVEEVRDVAARLVLTEGPAAEVEGRSLAGPGGPLPLRIYRPPSVAGPLGCVVFFGGGGYVLPVVPGHDALCRQLAVGSGCAVVSVQHRLAPEARFPAAVDDAYAATCWVHEHAVSLGVDHQRVAVGGQASGADLATVIARLAKERRNPALAFQLLLEPICDLRSCDFDAPPVAGLVPHDYARWYSDNYVRAPADRADPRCSPLLAKNLIGLPPALIVTGEYDPARAAAQAYAEALRAAHVPVSFSRYAGVVHGFMSVHAYVQRGGEALLECQQALRTALSAAEARG